MFAKTALTLFIIMSIFSSAAISFQKDRFSPPLAVFYFFKLHKKRPGIFGRAFDFKVLIKDITSLSEALHQISGMHYQE